MTAYSLTGGYGSPQIFSDGSVKETPIANLLALILVELRVANELHREAYGNRDDTNDIRQALFSSILNTSEIAAPVSIGNPT